MSSAVSESTKNICFESACFDAATVRQTSTHIGLRTDSLMRFEKSLDPLLAESAMLRALEMLTFLGKKATKQESFSYLDITRVNQISITLDAALIERKLGVTIASSEVERILRKLGFTVTMEGTRYIIQVPSWRATKDISIKEDIIEEIGRIYGYDKIPERPITGDFSIAAKNPDIILKNVVIDYFTTK
jgi:phenylalanyl-tRNA synthetase beta chain